MLIHPQFDPIALQLGPLPIRWYGLMYLLAFAFVIVLGRMRIKNQPTLNWTNKNLDDALFYGVLGVILGGRLGYILFYKPLYYLSHPLEIFSVWEGGMSFHGGLIGVLLAMWFFARKTGKPWLNVMDFIAPLVPLGLAAGRMGNFINAELWGRPTSAPWGMIFPHVDTLPRHPSQLYQFALEGILLFVILWVFARRPRPVGAVSGLFLSAYGLFRFVAEFTREPDEFLGVLSLGLTMGQWLSLPMIAIGIAMIHWAYSKRQAEV